MKKRQKEGKDLFSIITMWKQHTNGGGASAGGRGIFRVIGSNFFRAGVACGCAVVMLLHLDPMRLRLRLDSAHHQVTIAASQLTVTHRQNAGIVIFGPSPLPCSIV